MKNRLKIQLYVLVFSIFIVALLPAILNGTPASPAVGNWYQQFMSNIGGAQITYITFIDSLTGFSVTSLRTANDSSFILKTTNGGDVWNIIYRNNRSFVKIKFINGTTGFANSFFTIFKTTNSGLSWVPVNLPGIFGDDMFVLNDSTIWLAMSESLTGGVYRTTNGGGNWQQQLFLGSNNPEKIYMFNQRIGFISRNNGSSGYVRKTTDSGNTWSLIVNNDYYEKISFIDSLTGWKCSVFGMKKTTDGGLSWVTQILPNGGIIQTNGISDFAIINKDTIWANGGYVLYPNNRVYSIINRTTNGGINWLFQIPDTSTIDSITYFYVNFINKNNGWLTDKYDPVREIHTTNGGDTTFLTGLQQISNELPKKFKLHQNFPNPFNPTTSIAFQLPQLGFVTLRIFDLNGKEISCLVKEKLDAGEFKFDWNASGYSSGVYFYQLTVTNGKEVFRETKKMLMIK